MLEPSKFFNKKFPQLDYKEPIQHVTFNSAAYLKRKVQYGLVHHFEMDNLVGSNKIFLMLCKIHEITKGFAFFQKNIIIYGP